MVSKEENKLLTRVGPGTPMGEVMRRYWMPALLSHELPKPDCPPVRLKLLGEELVAFRDTNGRIGILEEFCAHRRASLWFGRNEECGLRCVFHGWKYDVDGNCVDQMNEPRDFKDKIHLTAYPAMELGGMIWAYMGPRELQPLPPKFAWTQAPESHRHVSKVIQECNWLQGLEGGVDTSHAQILHRVFAPTISKTGPGVGGDAPKLEIDVTDYGYRYAGIFPRGDEGNFVRAYHYVMPFTQMRPGPRERRLGYGRTNPRVHGHHWVPMDDENCMVWNWQYSIIDEPLSEEERVDDFLGNGPSHVDQTTFGSYRNRGNDYLIDREAQRDKSFTGIYGINTQDRAIQEGMGAIVDRSRENLGPADRAIVVTRRLLLEAIRTVEDGGSPPGVDDSYHALRAAQDIIPKDADWREALLSAMYSAGVQ